MKQYTAFRFDKSAQRFFFFSQEGILFAEM